MMSESKVGGGQLVQSSSSASDAAMREWIFSTIDARVSSAVKSLLPSAVDSSVGMTVASTLQRELDARILSQVTAALTVHQNLTLPKAAEAVFEKRMGDLLGERLPGAVSASLPALLAEGLATAVRPIVREATERWVSESATRMTALESRLQAMSTSSDTVDVRTNAAILAAVSTAGRAIEAQALADSERAAATLKVSFDKLYAEQTALRAEFKGLLSTTAQGAEAAQRAVTEARAETGQALTALQSNLAASIARVSDISESRASELTRALTSHADATRGGLEGQSDSLRQMITLVKEELLRSVAAQKEVTADLNQRLAFLNGVIEMRMAAAREDLKQAQARTAAEQKSQIDDITALVGRELAKMNEVSRVTANGLADARENLKRDGVALNEALSVRLKEADAVAATNMAALNARVSELHASLKGSVASTISDAATRAEQHQRQVNDSLDSIRDEVQKSLLDLQAFVEERMQNARSENAESQRACLDRVKESELRTKFAIEASDANTATELRKMATRNTDTIVSCESAQNVAIATMRDLMAKQVEDAAAAAAGVKRDIAATNSALVQSLKSDVAEACNGAASSASAALLVCESTKQELTASHAALRQEVLSTLHTAVAGSIAQAVDTANEHKNAAITALESRLRETITTESAESLAHATAALNAHASFADKTVSERLEAFQSQLYSELASHVAATNGTVTRLVARQEELAASSGENIRDAMSHLRAESAHAITVLSSELEKKLGDETAHIRSMATQVAENTAALEGIQTTILPDAHKALSESIERSTAAMAAEVSSVAGALREELAAQVDPTRFRAVANSASAEACSVLEGHVVESIKALEDRVREHVEARVVSSTPSPAVPDGSAGLQAASIRLALETALQQHKTSVEAALADVRGDVSTSVMRMQQALSGVADEVHQYTETAILQLTKAVTDRADAAVDLLETRSAEALAVARERSEELNLTVREVEASTAHHLDQFHQRLTQLQGSLLDRIQASERSAAESSSRVGELSTSVENLNVAATRLADTADKAESKLIYLSDGLKAQGIRIDASIEELHALSRQQSSTTTRLSEALHGRADRIARDVDVTREEVQGLRTVGLASPTAAASREAFAASSANAASVENLASQVSQQLQMQRQAVENSLEGLRRDLNGKTTAFNDNIALLEHTVNKDRQSTLLELDALRRTIADQGPATANEVRRQTTDLQASLRSYCNDAVSASSKSAVAQAALDSNQADLVLQTRIMHDVDALLAQKSALVGKAPIAAGSDSVSSALANSTAAGIPFASIDVVTEISDSVVAMRKELSELDSVAGEQFRELEAEITATTKAFDDRFGETHNALSSQLKDATASLQAQIERIQSSMSTNLRTLESTLTTQMHDTYAQRGDGLAGNYSVDAAVRSHLASAVQAQIAPVLASALPEALHQPLQDAISSAVFMDRLRASVEGQLPRIVEDVVRRSGSLPPTPYTAAPSSASSSLFRRPQFQQQQQQQQQGRSLAFDAAVEPASSVSNSSANVASAPSLANLTSPISSSAPGNALSSSFSASFGSIFRDAPSRDGLASPAPKPATTSTEIRALLQPRAMGMSQSQVSASPKPTPSSSAAANLAGGELTKETLEALIRAPSSKLSMLTSNSSSSNSSSAAQPK